MKIEINLNIMNKYTLFLLLFFTVYSQAQSFQNDRNRYELYTMQNDLTTKKNVEINTYALYPKKSEKNFKVIVFPNPVDNILNVITTSELSKIKYNLIDFSGKIVLKSEKEENTFSINMENFQSGVYVLQIESELETKSYKIIKK